MDITEELTHIGLCAGYGGIELGLKRVLPTLRTIALCEIEAFACANLVAKMEAGLMDPAPIWTDLKTFPWDSFRDRVDILSGGYPCQPFSTAGKRAGADDPRHLWPWIADGIRLMRPRVCFFENVEGHISLGLRNVLRELGELGYRATWGIFSAAEAGAPHQRKRVFIMAIASGFRGATGLPRSLTRHEGQSGVADNCGDQDMWPSRPGEPQHAWEPPRVVADTKGSVSGIEAKRQWRESAGGRSEEVVGNAASTGREGGGGADDSRWQVQRSAEPDGSGSNWEMESEQWQTQPTLGGDTDGAASGLDYAELYQSCDNSAGVSKYNSNGGRTIMANTANDGCASSSTSTRVCGAEPDTRGEEESQGVIQFKGSGTFSSLCISSDNRTDELRLLGNGVVPATAALALRTLLDELQRQ